MKVIRFIEKAVSSLRTLIKNLLQATQATIRSRIRHIPQALPKRRHEIIGDILERATHQDTLHELSRESGIPLDHLEETFQRYLREIAADLNYMTVPFWELLVTWVFGAIYEGYEVDRASLDKIREINRQRPIIFAANHRSHMDYLLISYILYRHHIPMPHVCAGANLSFWPMGWLFRKGGGFFIRRSYDGNKLYAYAVQAYIEELLRDRANVEFFIEGTRSRTGKLLPPRMGILSAIVQATINGAADDLLIVPTAVTYESVLEEKSYLQEQSGGVKKNESLWDLFRLQKYLRRRKGKVYIEFGEPISLQEFADQDFQDKKKEKIEDLAFEITYGINKATVVTPASLVATALLTHDRRSLSEEALNQKIEKYLDYLRFKECRLSEPLQRYQGNAIREALKYCVRNHWIEAYQDGGGLYRVKEECRPLIDYYKNTSISFFVSMGVLTTILIASKTDVVSLSQIEGDYQFLQNLLRYEFTFSWRRPLGEHLERLTNWTTLQTLPLLKDRRWESKNLIDFIQNQGKLLFAKEEISHLESVNKFTIENALRAFRDLGLVSEEKEGVGKKKRIFYRVEPGSNQLPKTQANRSTLLKLLVKN
ncbi:MAG: 1-acyl-sn-glycerol-3-phosphate acyltransferase [Deltaproteobacteria bacterium]|nr:1-acyl-sn-glycerol-3-phosphate acyltransferase [Deltaproteobacteria bacterium]